MHKTILICDDDEGIREALKLILESEYEVLLAKDGKEALEQVKSKGPDLVFLDIKLPQLSGIAVLKKIKAISKDIPVVMITGYKSTETAILATKEGACDYITKPIDKKEVSLSVKKALAG